MRRRVSWREAHRLTCTCGAITCRDMQKRYWRPAWSTSFLIQRQRIAEMERAAAAAAAPAGICDVNGRIVLATAERFQTSPLTDSTLSQKCTKVRDGSTGAWRFELSMYCWTLRMLLGAASSHPRGISFATLLYLSDEIFIKSNFSCLRIFSFWGEMGKIVISSQK